MEKWLRENLSNCLEFEIPDDMIKYILTMKSYVEFDEYFDTLLSKDCEEHRLFLDDCKRRLFYNATASKVSNQCKENKSNNQTLPTTKANTNNMNQRSAVETTHTSHHEKGAKKKTKFVNLYGRNGCVNSDVIMLKGRRLCSCQASKHKLINNCLSCGRIVCEQEGSGPCLFCGKLVCTNEEQKVLKLSGKKSEQLLKTLQEKGGGESLKQALEQRDRLLEYDRNSEKRTKVIDDELDYFEENSVWHSDEQRLEFERLRKELHEQKHASRANRKVKIDFAGREVNEDDTELEQKIMQEVSIINDNLNNKGDNWSNRKHCKQDSRNSIDLDPNMDAPRPIYRPTAEEKARTKDNSNDGLERCYNRVQDKELLEMQDMRRCLSMHQPWASLLVYGIKRHEGRIWYSGHRGRLWIASTAKEPRIEDIQEAEKFYKTYYKSKNMKFPEHYPAGCLLGCVKVDECLPQEEYLELYPDGESDSPYVFVCSNPEQLPVVFPIKGQHKIFQLEAKIHNTACKALLRLRHTKS